MNNSCQKTVPGYKNIVNKFMKIRNNTKLSRISKLRKIANIASSDEYKKVQMPCSVQKITNDVVVKVQKSF